MRQKNGAALIAILLMSSSATALAQNDKCPAQLERSAEAQVPKVSDWGMLHKAFRRYRKCDDGSIGESFSERVTVLLSTKWETLPQLGQLVAKDRPFASFVTKHVDATADPGNLQNIVLNVRQRGCPSLDGAMCKKLVTQAEEALKALATTQPNK